MKIRTLLILACCTLAFARPDYWSDSDESAMSASEAESVNVGQYDHEVDVLENDDEYEADGDEGFFEVMSEDCQHAEIKTQADIDRIVSCGEMGTLVMSNTDLTSLVLPNLVNADSITIDYNAHLKTVSLPSLRSANVLRLRNQTVISELNLSNLERVSDIEVITNLGLHSLEFNLRQAERVVLVDNVVKEIRGLDMEHVGKFVLQGHPALETVELTALKRASDLLEISNNNPNIVVKLPSLEKAQSIVVSSFGHLEAPALTDIHGTFELVEFTSSSITLPVLTTVGATFAIHSSNTLNEVEFPHLNYLGGDLYVANVSSLESLGDGFPQLNTVGGSIHIDGEKIRSLSFPSIKEVRGALLVKASGLDCNSVKTETSTVVLGEFECGESVVVPSLPRSGARNVNDDSKDEDVQNDVASHQAHERANSGSKVSLNILALSALLGVGILF